MSNEPAGAGGAIIAAALILGVSILGGGYLVTQAVNQHGNELNAVLTALAERPSAGGAPTAQRAPTPNRPARPDPARVYEVEVGEAPVRGPESAEVTIVEFSDFQCPFCRRVTPTLDQIREKYGDQVRVAFKHLPLSIHPKAPAAHAAAEAAHRQGRFWEMHDKIFADQRGMSEEKYQQYAKELELDLDRFRKDLESAAVKQRVDADTAEAARLGVTGTPSFFVNGRYLSGAQPLESFSRLIDEELAKAKS